jgi:hypothetical protein
VFAGKLNSTGMPGFMAELSVSDVEGLRNYVVNRAQAAETSRLPKLTIPTKPQWACLPTEIGDGGGRGGGPAGPRDGRSGRIDRWSSDVQQHGQQQWAQHRGSADPDIPTRGRADTWDNYDCKRIVLNQHRGVGKLCAGRPCGGLDEGVGGLSRRDQLLLGVIID